MVRGSRKVRAETVTYDAVRGVAVSSAIESALGEATERGELDTTTADVHLLLDDGEVAVGVGLGEVVDEGRVQVERGAEDLLVVPEGVTRERAHVGDGLGGGQAVHGDLGLGRTELEGGGAGGRREVDDLDEVHAKVARVAVLGATADEVLRKDMCVSLLRNPKRPSETHRVRSGGTGVEPDTSKLEERRDTVRLDVVPAQDRISFGTVCKRQKSF